MMTTYTVSVAPTEAVSNAPGGTVTVTPTGYVTQPLPTQEAQPKTDPFADLAKALAKALAAPAAEAESIAKFAIVKLGEILTSKEATDTLAKIGATVVDAVVKTIAKGFAELQAELANPTAPASEAAVKAQALAMEAEFAAFQLAERKAALGKGGRAARDARTGACARERTP